MHAFRFPLFPISRAQARPPRPPPIVCLVECSFAAVSVGLFSAVTTALGNIAATLPPYAEIALIAYDDAVHFFSFGDTGIVQLTAPDANEACLPLPPSRLLFSLGESLDSFEELLRSLPKFLSQSRRADTALGTALQAAQLLLCRTGGRLLFFQHMLPSRGNLKLQQRDDLRLCMHHCTPLPAVGRQRGALPRFLHGVLPPLHRPSGVVYRRARAQTERTRSVASSRPPMARDGRSSARLLRRSRSVSHLSISLQLHF